MVVSVGSLGSEAAIARFALIGEADRKALREYGGVGEMLCNVFDREGRIVEHPLNQRVMSVPIESVRAAPIRVLAAGGAHKQAAIVGAIKLLEADHARDRRGDRAEADGRDSARHRTVIARSHRASKDARLSTGYDDEAIHAAVRPATAQHSSLRGA